MTAPAGDAAADARLAHRADIVVIGVSTGGPDALAHLLPALPVDLPVPVLVVLHIPVSFLPSVVDRLSRKTMLQVAEAVDGTPLEPGVVWFAPGDQHMVVHQVGDKRRIHLHS